jgi:hypothetical protein
MHLNIVFTLLVSLCSVASAVDQITVCRNFGGPQTPDASDCANFDIKDALTAGVNIPRKEITRLLGGAPSSAKVLTPGIICGIGNEHKRELEGFFNFVGHCRGTRMLIFDDHL